MQLKTALKIAGYTVINLTDRLQKRYAIGYKTVCKYARCYNRNYGDPIVWKFIDECLAEIGVKWIEYNRYDARR